MMEKDTLHMSHRYAISDISQVGEARRFAKGLAVALDFGASETEKIAIIVTELSSNLVKHGHGGQILLRPIDDAGEPGLEVLALDRGAGMRDAARCLQDGFSTAGTAGTGLGAVKRLSTSFGLFSQPGRGTAVLSQVLASPSAEPRLSSASAVSVPYPGERVCGDAWTFHDGATQASFLVADGLGHGPLASEAAQGVIAVFQEQPEATPTALLESAHRALRSTRGAAVAIASIDKMARRVRYAGVGNIAASILAGEHSQSLVSHNGTIGQQVRKIQEFTYDWPKQATLVMHSDGLTSRWDTDSYPGLLQQHPALIAGVLYRDFTRGRDDVTVLVHKG